MKKTYITLGLLLIIVVIILGLQFWNTNIKQNQEEKKSLQVVTTLFPLYDFAKNIGQEQVEVTLLLPPATEPHSFEPTPSDIIKIYEADIFIYTNPYLEPWAVDIIKSLPTSVMVVNVSEDIPFLSSVAIDKHEPIDSMDPHIWLDFDRAKKMVQNITKAFSQKDAVHANQYEQASKQYQQILSELDNQYQEGLSDCLKHEVIYAGHYAFGYLTARYGLEYVAAQGVSPDAEPTAQDLIKLINQIKDQDIHWIFYEELASPKIAQMLSTETQTKLLLLHPAHNLSKDQMQESISFQDIMKQNLLHLQTGLECKP